MTTMREAHSHNAYYYGDHPDWIIAIATNRDADTLEEANWNTAKAWFARDVPKQSFACESSSHWLVGWVEYLCYNPRSRKAAALAADIAERLENYPVLDEDEWSRLESEYFTAWVDSEKDHLCAACVSGQSEPMQNYGGCIEDASAHMTWPPVDGECALCGAEMPEEVVLAAVQA